MASRSAAVASASEPSVVGISEPPWFHERLARYAAVCSKVGVERLRSPATARYALLAVVSDVPRSPVPVRGEDVIFCRRNLMARGPALGVLLSGRERVGRGIVGKL